jgi:hypothetical protein
VDFEEKRQILIDVRQLSGAIKVDVMRINDAFVSGYDR